MKHKTIIPTAEDVAAQGEIQIDFTGLLEPGDPQLPKPKNGFFPKLRKRNLVEVLKLEAVRAKGGLVPDNGDRLVWACTVCGELFQAEGQASHCCRSEPKLITVCVGCQKPPHKCRCSWRKH